MSDKKKVLIITYYWPPSGGSGVQRWVKFCKYLPEFDIEPIVLTVSNPTYPLIDNTLDSDISKSLLVFKSKSFEPYSLYAKLLKKDKTEVSTPASVFSNDKSFIKSIGVWIRANLFIPDARRGWVNSTTQKAKSIIKEYNIDTIITTGPPNSTHLIGTNLKKWNTKLSWIMDMRDPWTKIFFNQQMPRTKFAESLDKSYERNALKIADRVIVISNGMQKVQNAVLNRHYDIISNGFDHEDFKKTEIDYENDKSVIRYIGSMTESAIPYSFFGAVQKLSEKQKGKLKIEFYGSINSKVNTLIKEYELEEITSIYGYVPHIEAKKLMQTTDILLLVIPKTVDNELIITGKIFDYVAAQKPILCIGPKNGDASSLIEEHVLGITFDYDDQSSIISFLSTYISENNIEYRSWDKDFKTHPFSRFSLTRQLSTVIIGDLSDDQVKPS